MPFNLAETFVATTELELGTTLPTFYKQAMQRDNGGEVEAAGDSWTLYPIADTSDQRRLARTANHIIKETQSCRSWPNFPRSAVAIAGNGTGGQLVFIMDGSSLGLAVHVWSHETGIAAKVANDFSELKPS